MSSLLSQNSIATPLSLYVLIDIGCIECGESSNLLGIFTSKIDAEARREKAEKAHNEHWSGEHNFEIFETTFGEVK